MKELAKQMSEAISTERERRFIADEAALETVLRENGWCKQSEVIYDHHGQVACYTFGCTEADKVREEVAREIFARVRKAFYDVSSVTHNELTKAIRDDDQYRIDLVSGIDVTLRTVRGIIEEFAKEYAKGGG